VIASFLLQYPFPVQLVAVADGDVTHENTLVVPYVKGSADRHAN
jgi:hypothetical protein